MKNKEKFNYTLINITLFVFIIYLLNKLNVLNKLIDLIILLILSLIISYIIYPIYKTLKKRLNKFITIFLIYGLLILLILFIIYSIIPSTDLILKITDLLDNIIKFINKLNIKYDLNINIDIYLNKILNYIVNNSFFVIKNIFSFLSNLLFVLILSICILFNIDILKNNIHKFKYRELFYNINDKLKNYVIANIKIIIIQMIEYTFIFYIIGHPNYLLLGILNSLNTFIPIFGSVISNTISVITASVISTKLLILTGLVSLILPNIDAYVITPKIYKDTNKLSQTLSITSIIVGGILFGFYGMILSLPVIIIIIEIIKYKNNLKNK